MQNDRINLYSDTQTKPTPAMRRAMAEAEVGDEQRFEDPTVNALTERVADLLGKEAAVYLPSGTMCNELAIRVHCQPGDEVICDSNAHIIIAEGGAPAALSGVVLHGIEGDRGIFSASQTERAVRAPNRHSPRSRLVSVEQTSNWGGGTVWPLDDLLAVAGVARAHGLATHMDGARLMNAVVASGIAASDFAAGYDSVWVDFSKGLGAPVGAALAGSRAFIDEAWRFKQGWGGAMRQAGIIAAGALYALDHHVDRLAEDHANARLLAGRLASIAGIAIDPSTVDTNIVWFDVSGTGVAAPEISQRLAEQGVMIGAFGPHRMRAVTHLDVGRDEIVRATDILAGIVG